jgi:hypothetical protein
MHLSKRWVLYLLRMLANLSSLVHKRVKTTKKTNVKIIKRAKKSHNSDIRISVSETFRNKRCRVHLYTRIYNFLTVDMQQKKQGE